MRVPADHSMNSCGFGNHVQFAQVVQYVEARRAGVHHRGLRQFLGPLLRVHIATHRKHRSDLLQPHQDPGVAHVTGVYDQINSSQRAPRLRPQQPMSVGDNSNAHFFPSCLSSRSERTPIRSRDIPRVRHSRGLRACAPHLDRDRARVLRRSPLPPRTAALLRAVPPRSPNPRPLTTRLPACLLLARPTWRRGPWDHTTPEPLCLLFPAAWSCALSSWFWRDPVSFSLPPVFFHVLRLLPFSTFSFFFWVT